MRKIVLLLVGVFLLLVGCNKFIDTVEQTKELELEVDSISTLTIDSESPDITVIGDESISTIKVVAEIETSKKEKDNYVLQLKQQGEKAVLEAGFKGSFGVIFEKMDVTVTMPATLGLDVDDQSGNLDISNLKGNVTVADQSGNIALEKITGTLEIDDQSGNIDIKEAARIVKIDDDSGRITITKSGGDVELTDDSGDAEIAGYTGDLVIKDQSGDLAVTSVNGSLTVDDQSGDIAVKNIEKNVTINDDGSGKLEVENIKGDYVRMN